MATISCSDLGCECACHRAKRRQPPRVFTPEMDRVLCGGLDRGNPVRDIAARLHLTESAVRWRIRQLNLSTRDGWRSRQEVVAALGVSRRAVDRWVRDGRLRMTFHGTRWTRVTDGDLRAFVDRYAGALFEPLAVVDPALRRLAETSAMVHRRRAV